MAIRTDLAVELFRDLDPHDPALAGIEWKEEKGGILPVERVTVKSDEAAKLLGKERGRYLTAETGRLWMDDRGVFKQKVFAFRDLLRPFLHGVSRRGGAVLVAGLGNRAITADAVGPAAVKNLVVTRHIKEQAPLVFEDLGLGEVCAVTPGVLGETGIESGDAVKSLAALIRPKLVIVIDALAAREIRRLVRTVQISDTGLSPGAGVGNRRPEITEKTVGAPVISLGIPTVTDAATLAADAARRFGVPAPEEEAIRKRLSEDGLNYFVTPKETDQIVRFMGAFVGYALNLALNERLSYEDMLSLIG